MTTIVDRSSIIQIQKTANTQSEEPTVPNKDLEKNKKKGNLLVTKTVKMVDNQCPLLVSKKIKQSEDQVEKKFISNKKRINEAIKGKNKEKKIRKDGTKNSQEHEILAKLNETVSLDHLTARDNAKNQDNSNAKKIMEKITSSNSEMIPVKKGRTVYHGSKSEVIIGKSEIMNLSHGHTVDLSTKRPIKNKPKKRFFLLQRNFNLKTYLKKSLINLHRKLLQNVTVLSL
ncbi:hypothetical protein LOAG_07010 [Loa loa]|uniref:Uncharacterized protein n=1 Tax=Loa loa TaxID=7209 RepID=A0A1S0TWX6_LOALO|nr:hypothetical protein LOAG_07010 [Loa loa]EFO21476.2 hypothetical protein LOAG_07010 [Loa loa]